MRMKSIHIAIAPLDHSMKGEVPHYELVDCTVDMVVLGQIQIMSEL